MPRRTALPILAAVTALGCYDAEAGRDVILDQRLTPKVLLIGIDGVRPDVLAEVDTPVLDSLAAAGMIVTDARTTTPSVSGPSWSSMITGVWPEKHGVTSNAFEVRHYDRYPDFLTRLETTDPALATFAAVDWLPLVDQPDDVEAVSASVDRRVIYDGYELGWMEADIALTEALRRSLTAEDLDAVFLYLGNPDETSHQTGSIGDEYREAIEAADAMAGDVLEAVAARSTYDEEDWLVLVSTDHGRLPDGGHGGGSDEEMTIFVIASGAAFRGVSPPTGVGIVDVAATALAHMTAIDPEWGLDGVPLQGR